MLSRRRASVDVVEYAGPTQQAASLIEGHRTSPAETKTEIIVRVLSALTRPRPSVPTFDLGQQGNRIWPASWAYGPEARDALPSIASSPARNDQIDTVIASRLAKQWRAASPSVPLPRVQRLPRAPKRAMACSRWPGARTTLSLPPVWTIHPCAPANDQDDGSNEHGVRFSTPEQTPPERNPPCKGMETQSGRTDIDAILGKLLRNHDFPRRPIDRPGQQIRDVTG